MELTFFLIISESALNFDQQLSCEQLNKLLEPKSSLNQNQILQNYNVKSKVFFFSFSIHFSLIFSKSKEWFCSWYIRFHNSWYKPILSILIQVKIISMIKLTCFDIWWNSNVSVLLTLCKWQISVHYKSYPNRYRKKQFLTQCCCILELRRPPTAIVVQTQTVMIRFTSKNSLFLYHWFQDLILCD